MDRLLVMRGGALGDFILGLSALRVLRESFPATHLELVAPAAVLPLATHLADTVTPIERGEIASLFGDPERFPQEVADRYRDLDLAVIWLADADGSLRRSFQRLGARRLLWAPALPSQSGPHATDHLLHSLRPLLGSCCDTPPCGSRPLLQPRAAAEEKASAVWHDLGLSAGRPVVALHPGSGGEWKRWPADRFAQVADRLVGSGLRVTLIQGPADERALEEVVSYLLGWRPPVIAGLSVEELAAFLARCGCYLGNDSGVTHLAAAAGTPTVAVFGPTDPAVWGPRGSRVTILRGEQGCPDCGRRLTPGCAERSCLMAVTVEQVVEAITHTVNGPAA